MEDCLFCKIINKQIPSNIVYESDNLVVFPDINPSADLHLLLVPKQHVGGVLDLNKDNKDLLAEIYETVNMLVRERSLQNDLYRVVVNGGKAQHVPHLHFHFLGGQWKKMV
ncbi:HIT domain-containing protein [Candidatus Daviesbacteria bacterium]|nr:HIT domain-containing protein [Candidatus Daviesbacteria bacterium]